MKKETYFCNLCQEERDAKDLYTFYNRTSGYVLLQRTHAQWKDADKHVCKRCVEAIRNGSES